MMGFQHVDLYQSEVLAEFCRPAAAVVRRLARERPPIEEPEGTTFANTLTASGFYFAAQIGEVPYLMMGGLSRAIARDWGIVLE